MSKIANFFKWLGNQLTGIVRDCPPPLLPYGLAFLAAGIAVFIFSIVMTVWTQDLQMLVLLFVGLCIFLYGRYWLTGYRRGAIVAHNVVCIAVDYQRRKNSIYAVFRDLDTNEQYSHTIYGRRECPYVERGKYTIYMQANSKSSILGYTQ